MFIEVVKFLIGKRPLVEGAFNYKISLLSNL